MKILTGIRCGLLMCGLAVIAGQPAYAANPSFADLLARAKTQAASGHRWAPAGDNMTETVMAMMDLIPTATPSQLAELLALLQTDQPSPAKTALAPPPKAVQTLPPATAPSSVPATAQTPPPRTTQAPGPKATQTPPPATAQTPPPATAQNPPPRTTQAPGPKATQTPVPATAQNNSPATALDARSVVAQPLLPPLQENPPPSGNQQASLETPPRVHSIPLSPPALVKPPSIEAPGAAVPQAGQPGPGTRTALLFARGLEAEHRGDLSEARRFYSSAARQGDAAAARKVGRLYDPAYLRQTAVGGIDPDPTLAREWYKRAVTLGDAEALPLLEALSVR
jgi:hypothetical protein